MGSKKTSGKEQQPRRQCLFCSSWADSAEHVFPNWLNKLGLGGEGVRQFGNEVGQIRYEQGGPFSKKIKVVCRPCNNVWMSGMEAEARPALTRMLAWDGRNPLQFDAAAQRALARWAFKTAAVAAHLESQQTFPLPHCRAFRQSDQLPRCEVRIGFAKAPPTQQHPYDSRTYDEVGESQFQPATATAWVDGKPTTFPFYRATFRLFNIVFDVMGYVSNDIHLTVIPPQIHQEALTQVWPTTVTSVTWPPAKTVDSIGGVAWLVSSHHAS
ncbi:hypothetical protein [Streptomyces goshikiensis]